MKTRLLSTAAGVRTFVVVFDSGDDVMQGPQSFSTHKDKVHAHVVVESTVHLHRTADPATGLALIDLDASA
jgi:hypothetical protein